MNEQVELRLYGCTTTEIRQAVAAACSPAKLAVSLMVAAAQELHDEHYDRAGQLMCRAKYILGEYCTEHKDKPCD